jgi:uncharacterized membrane protein YeaQ/YmgE (transglycosylase-associated protein family)
VSIIAWLVIGAIAGYVANYFLGTRSGVIMTVLFGIVGAVVGGLIGAYIRSGTFDLNNIMGQLDLTSVITAIIGALGVGALGGWWARRNAST